MTEIVATEIPGWKLLKLRWNGHAVQIAPLFRRKRARKSFPVEAQAVCDSHPLHTAPEWDCLCGFHAVEDRDELWRVGERSWGVLDAEVSLAGRVIEHEHGWRGAWQRVDTLRIEDGCTWCQEGVKGVARARRSELWPSCGSCGRGFISLRDLGLLTGCIVNLDPAQRRVGYAEVQTARRWARGGVAALLLTGVVLSLLTRQPALVCVAGGSSVLWHGVAVWRAGAYLEQRGVPETARSAVLAAVRAEATWLGMIGWLLAGAVGFAL